MLFITFEPGVTRRVYRIAQDRLDALAMGSTSRKFYRVLCIKGAPESMKLKLDTS